jgi:cytochrome c-type biogenesis protein CcmH/NrfF
MLLFTAAAVLLFAANPARALEPRTSLTDIEDEVMCPICGTLLEHSQAPQADRQRALIRRLVDQGRTKEEVKEALVAEYGREVLATPDRAGFDLTAWVVPAIALIACAAGIAVAVNRSSRSDQDSDDVPAPLAPDDARRLDLEMARDDD